MNATTLVRKLWNYCNILRDDGLSYGDYPGSKSGAGMNS
jgi:type I restriction enzyme M protein